jgi:hypothetical protein
MYVLSFRVNSVSFYISALFLPSSLYFDEFSKVFIKHSLKVLMFSKDLLKFHCVEICYVACVLLLP